MDAKPLDQWVTELSGAHLPLLKASREELDKLGPLEGVTLARFSNIALTDPGLTLTLLRAACAMPRARLQEEIHTVDGACLKLGMAQTAEVIEQMAFIDDVVKEETKQRYLQLTSRAYHAAYQAYSFARERVDMAPEELFTAAILQNIGLLMLLVHQPDCLAGFDDLDNIEEQQERLGFTLRELSLGLAKEWKLSSFIQKAMELGDGEGLNNPRLYEIFLADNLAIEVEKGWESEAMTELMEKIAGHLHSDVEQIQADIRETAITTAEETTSYGVMPIAATIPDLDEDLLASLTADIPDPIPIAPKKTDYGLKPGAMPPANKNIPPATLEADVPRVSPTNVEKYNNAMAEAKSLLRSQFNLSQFMKCIQEGFVDGLRMNRAFFAMLDQDHKNLCTRFIFGNEAGIRNLRIPINEQNLFARLISKPQALHCRPENQAKVIPLIPRDFHKLIDTPEFFLMNIQVKGKTLGVVYADRYGNDYGIDKKDFDKLCQLCLVLGKGFERIRK